ncbi:MAG: hypothetical protein GY858_02295 [Candidatus Omnitrophica bacterium]|nr:hypothetical protein [Candidatus Omnitrophota bacterium]
MSRVGLAANAGAAASSSFFEEQQRFRLASPIENEGIGNVGGAANDEIEDYLSQFSDVVHHYIIKRDKIYEFNYPIDVLNIKNIKKILADIFEQLPQKKQAVISLEVGYILSHSVTGELRYFFGSWNTTLGDVRVMLNPSDTESLKKAIEYYSSLDLNLYLNNNHIPSLWQLERVVNLHCIVQFFRPEVTQNQIS